MQPVGFPYNFSLREHLRRGLWREPPRFSLYGQGTPDWAAWREGLTTALREMVRVAESPVPVPQVRLLDQEDRGDQVWERVAIQVAEDLAVPAYLLSPRDPDLPAPGVLYLEDALGGKAGVVGELSGSETREPPAAVVLCGAGLRVLVPDLPGAGERQDDLAGLAGTLLAGGDSLCGWAAREALTMLAYLRSLPETPPGQVGLCAVGEALWPGLLAAALDLAVKAVALQGDLASPAEQLLESSCLARELESGTRWWPPGILSLAETADLGALLAPRPLLLSDPVGSRRTRRLMEQAYGELGCKPRLEMHTEQEPPPGETLAEFFGVWLPAELSDLPG